MEPHYFLAVSLTQPAEEHLALQQEQWKKIYAFKKWTHPEDFHLTLSFLGSADSSFLEQFKTCLQEKLPVHHSFEVEVREVGTFGHSLKPRILWAGPEASDSLEQLYEDVQLCLEEAGRKRENRPFRPHITVAKKWDHQEPIALKQDLLPFILEVKDIVLYQIFPEKTPKYKGVWTYELTSKEGGD
ncbi:RNA 2',3'-cyclic phosphodiesterase [Jeotgalibacillus aurantiacus]|uniref:RNA 2',3'-cyclic phosphodiesterase n=1 Tax=Jeotgalibacillus aurantiacus TaxID=2763266 RepID=UPI001D0B31C5|nr:RNA 2',3'-cyclic phosphodiesterase [Jeotgalibacillus aurantiacus]